MLGTTKLGVIVSNTVTVAVAVPVLPEASVELTVTVFAPKSEHPKLVTSTVVALTPQLSDELACTSDTAKLADPDASKYTVAFCVDTTGTALSTTVTIDVAVLTLPFTSVDVIVTVFAPKSEHPKLLTSKLVLDKLQLSVTDDSNTSLNTMLADPDASNTTVAFFVAITGDMVSITVMSNESITVNPTASTKVYTTVVVPKLK